MKVICDSCQAECEITVRGPTLLRRALPKGWRPRRIDGRVYVLCDICGNLRQFVGGLSPYLASRLNLPSNVTIELPEYTELPDAWLKRSSSNGLASRSTEPQDRFMTDINKFIAAGDDGLNPERTARAAELADWSPERANETAKAEELELTAAHMEVLGFLQGYYLENGAVRRARDLASVLDRHFATKGGRRYLFELFPRGPVSQGGRLAGVPVPSDAQDVSFGSVL